MSIRQGNKIIAGVTSTNYNDFSNKPQINSIELVGNKTLDELSIQHKLTAGKNISIENNTISSIGGGNNIGDIFYTIRKDNELNGAVECNGAQYNFADINEGNNNIQSLLENGSLPYISIAEFDAMIAEQGGCDSFGYKIKTNWVEWEGIRGNNVYTSQYYLKIGDNVYDSPGGKIIGTIDYIDYGNEDRTFMSYIAVEGGTSGSGQYLQNVEGPDLSTTYFKVPKKLGRVLVRSQKPDASNNYTWYNLYSDGWVEQGGRVQSTGSAINVAITLPIEMKDSNYHKIKTLYGGVGTGQGFSWEKVSDMTSGQIDTTTIAHFYVTTNAAALGSFWQVIGYANSAEYTKDKWDYQNIKVERYMVQLFNGTTDTALATCTGVLADVANLKNLSNITQTGKEATINWIMPSEDYVEYDCNNGNTSFEVPFDGYACAIGKGSENAQSVIDLYLQDSSGNILIRQRSDCYTPGQDGACWIPCVKGATVTVYYARYNTQRKLRFIKPKGLL